MTTVLVHLFIFSSVFCYVNPDCSDDVGGPVAGGDNDGGPVAGGVSPMDLSDPSVRKQVQNLTNFAVTQLDARSNDMYHSNSVRIVNATSQVVEGMSYEITFYIGQNDCRKNKASDEKKFSNGKCTVKNDGRYEKCTVSIWEKPWEDFLQMTNWDCKTVKRSEATKS